MIKIDFQAVNFDLEPSTVAYGEKKLQKLSQFYDKIISLTVIMKIENTKEKENKFVEIKMDIPGNSLIIKKAGRSFEEAIDLAEESLKKSIKRTKDKLNSH